MNPALGPIALTTRLARRRAVHLAASRAENCSKAARLRPGAARRASLRNVHLLRSGHGDQRKIAARRDSAADDDRSQKHQSLPQSPRLLPNRRRGRRRFQPAQFAHRRHLEAGAAGTGHRATSLPRTDAVGAATGTRKQIISSHKFVQNQTVKYGGLIAKESSSKLWRECPPRREWPAALQLS